MPEGRLIKKKIVDDYRLNNVSVEAELLYIKMIPHLDREGRLQADPKLINKKFYALRDFTAEEVELWLNDLANQKKNGKGLIELYEVEGHKYLWMPGFEGEQSGSWQRHVKQKEAPSAIPPPPGMPSSTVEVVPPTRPDIVGERVARNITLFEDLAGRLATPNELDSIKDDTDKYPEGWFEKAVEEAKKHGKRSLRYIEVILERWHNEGINPLEETKSGTHQGSDKPTTTSLKDSIGEPLT